MKFRSLFLATLAVMAMASCSNENDPITDNGNGEKNAIFNFSIALPNNGTTKADGNEAGTLKEQKVNNITLVLTYEGGIPVFTKTYQVNEFTQSGSIYTLTNAEQVSAGTATATYMSTTMGFPAIRQWKQLSPQDWEIMLPQKEAGTSLCPAYPLRFQ